MICPSEMKNNYERELEKKVEKLKEEIAEKDTKIECLNNTIVLIIKTLKQ